MMSFLLEWAKARGFEIACGPVDVVAEVWRDLETRRRAGELEDAFVRDRLSWFRYPEGMPSLEAVSVIMIAVPRPAHTVTFVPEDGPMSVLIPPTYVAYGRTRELVRQELAASVFRGIARLELLPAPLKAVAARLGLVRYGLNNITYSPSFGSYHQLMGFVTDAELTATRERRSSAPEVLPTCESCQACRRACPTRAIGEDRFLLHAERCLTLYTEASGSWPAGLDASVHHCLIGCMFCQKTCPENAGLLRLEPAKLSFSQAETAALLADPYREGQPLSRKILAKLEALELGEYAPLLGRNLRALVSQRARG